MIAILCPTRGRPEQLRRMVESVAQTVSDPVYIAIAPTRPSDIYLPDINGKTIISKFEYPDNLPTAQKWNNMAEAALKSEANLFMLGSDDMYFATSGWDKALIDHYNALENKIHVYALQDSRDVDGTPHPVFTREWIEFWGYMLNPMWLHWYVDTWAVEIAKANNCFTHLRGFSLQHIKPSDEGRPDETHNRIRSFGWAERDRFVWKNSQPYLEFDKKRLAGVFV